MNPTPPTRTEIVGEHLPFRLTALDGLLTMMLLRCPEILRGVHGTTLDSIVLKVNNKEQLPFIHIYNSVIDAGFAHARSLIHFLGLRKSQKNDSRLNDTTNNRSNHGTDISMSDVDGAGTICVNQIRQLSPDLDMHGDGGVFTLEQILVYVIKVADKSVEHFTYGYPSGWPGHIVHACMFIELAIEILVYHNTCTPIPVYQNWSTQLLSATQLRALQSVRLFLAEKITPILQT